MWERKKTPTRTSAQDSRLPVTESCHGPVWTEWTILPHTSHCSRLLLPLDRDCTLEADYISSCHGTLQIHLCKIRIPEVVLSDNSPQFSSQEFLKFSPRLLFHSYYQYIILKEMVKQKGLFRQWEISWKSPLTLTLPFSTTVQLHFYMATVQQNWWWAKNWETVCLQSWVNIFPSNQKSKNSRRRMNTRSQQKYYHDLWHRAKEVT